MSIPQTLLDKISDQYVNNLIEKNSPSSSYDSFIDYLSRQFNYSGFLKSWIIESSYQYSGSHTSINTSLEYPMVELNQLLLHHYPDMTITQYNKIEQAIERFSGKERDSYGETNVGKKFLSYQKLQKLLVDFSLEPSSPSIESSSVKQYLTNKYSKDWFSENMPQELIIDQSSSLSNSSNFTRGR